MKTLVTGGAGFIGSNLVDCLLDYGASVTVFDNLSTGKRENLSGALDRGAELEVGDVTDEPAVTAVVEKSKPDVVFHLAAQIDVRRAVSDPAFDAQINVGGTVTLLEAARRNSVGRFIFVSTGGALYGDAEVIPTPESAPIAPLAPYGTSKYAAETYCELYSRLYGMSTVCLRLANVYGPRQDPLGEGGVVAIFSGVAAAGQVAPVFGDGQQTRDFIYVGDVADALLLAAQTKTTGAHNIGTGTETTVLELARALHLEPTFQPPRAGEVQRSCLDTQAAARELGFQASTPLIDGLKRTALWISETNKAHPAVAQASTSA